MVVQGKITASISPGPAPSSLFVLWVFQGTSLLSESPKDRGFLS